MAALWPFDQLRLGEVMTDTDNLDDLANAIPKSSPKIRAYAVAQAAASQSQELDIRDALSRIAALEVPSPEPEPEPQPEPEPPSPIAYPASYYTGPLGQNNILPTKRGAFLITWGISMPSGSMEWPEQKANILTRESAMGRRYDGLMVLDTPEYWSEGRMEWVRDHGSIPIVAGYGYSLGGIAGIAAGQKDAVIDAQADHWKALGVPLIVRLFHEFDLPGVPYTMQGVAASTWISAWRRIVERVQNRGATNVGFWWCPVEGYDRAKTSAVWPGDEYVDWSGSDNYNAQAHGGTGYVTPLHPGWAEFWELFDYGEAWSGGDSYLDAQAVRGRRDGLALRPKPAGKQGRLVSQYPPRASQHGTLHRGLLLRPERLSLRAGQQLARGLSNLQPRLSRRVCADGAGPLGQHALSAMRILTNRDPCDEMATVRDLDVVTWRFDRLSDAGYPADLAVMLAERGDVDLHGAVALLERGATVHEALRILT